MSWQDPVIYDTFGKQQRDLLSYKCSIKIYNTCFEEINIGYEMKTEMNQLVTFF